MMEQTARENGEDDYNVACLQAQLSRLAGSGSAPVTEQERAERSTCLDRALDALRKAVAAGNVKLARLKKESSLGPLRSRDDFQKLLGELEKQDSDASRLKSEVGNNRH
jgi:hypothetical protein